MSGRANPRRALARWARAADTSRSRGGAATAAALRTDAGVWLVSRYAARLVTPADGALWLGADEMATLGAEHRANGPAIVRTLPGVPWGQIYGADGASIDFDGMSALTAEMVAKITPLGGWAVTTRHDVTVVPVASGDVTGAQLLRTDAPNGGGDVVVNPALLATLGAHDRLRTTGARRPITATRGEGAGEVVVGCVMSLNTDPAKATPVDAEAVSS